MRTSLFAGVEAGGYEPKGFAPYQSHVPTGTAQRLDGMTHPVANPTNPGYAYGTVIPVMQSAKGMSMVRWYGMWTLPVGKNFSNQVPMKPQIQGVTMDPTRATRILGSVSNVPGYDYSGLAAIQMKLAASRR